MIDILLRDGWSYHDIESPRLAGELEAAVDVGVADAAVVPLLHLATHTIGEHLGDWPRARRLAERVLAGRSPTADTAQAWARLAIARGLDGDPRGAAIAELAFLDASPAGPTAAQIEARFMLVAALVGSRRTREAIGLYATALSLAEAAGEAAPSRAIAIASNNLASELVEAHSRTAEEDTLMRSAAAAARQHWRRCGTWVNEERALYLEALVANALGQSLEALEHSDAALSLIVANNGYEPVDTAFLHLARCRAFSLLGDIAARDVALARADAEAAGFPEGGIKTWFEEERAKSLA